MKWEHVAIPSWCDCLTMICAWWREIVSQFESLREIYLRILSYMLYFNKWGLVFYLQSRQRLFSRYDGNVRIWQNTDVINFLINTTHWFLTTWMLLRWWLRYWYFVIVIIIERKRVNWTELRSIDCIVNNFCHIW